MELLPRHNVTSWLQTTYECNVMTLIPTRGAQIT